MALAVFKRYEKKYLMTEEQYRGLMLTLSGVIDMDGYGRHTICNIYLDNPDYELIRASIEKPVYKEKIRLRCYGTEIDNGSAVFLEIKKKYDSVVYKRREEMDLETARKYIYYGIRPRQAGQILKEADYTIRRYGLRPMVYISYERTAYTCQTDQEVRVTFDRNILGRLGEVDLRVKPYGKCLLPANMVLMEIKIPDAMPVWLSRILAEQGIYPAAYSKYGTFYQKYVQPEMAAEYKGRMEWRKFTQGGLVCA